MLLDLQAQQVQQALLVRQALEVFQDRRDLQDQQVQLVLREFKVLQVQLVQQAR